MAPPQGLIWAAGPPPFSRTMERLRSCSPRHAGGEQLTAPPREDPPPPTPIWVWGPSGWVWPPRAGTGGWGGGVGGLFFGVFCWRRGFFLAPGGAGLGGGGGGGRGWWGWCGGGGCGVLLFMLAHPRWEMVFQPKYAAYLNLIEPWWKVLRSLALKGRRFETWDEVTTPLHPPYKSRELFSINLRSGRMLLARRMLVHGELVAHDECGKVIPVFVGGVLGRRARLPCARLRNGSRIDRLRALAKPSGQAPRLFGQA